MPNIFKSVLLMLFLLTVVYAQPAHNEQILSASGGDAVSMDKEWVFVGDADANVTHVYKLDYNNFQWVEQQPLFAPNKGDFGRGVSVNGVNAIIGAPNAGDWQMTVESVTINSTTGNGGTFTSITFPEAFDTVPVVFILSTSQGNQSGAIRIKNVTKTGFDAAPVEPEPRDGKHVAMTNVHYMAVEKGRHVFTNGYTVVVGETNTTHFQMNPATGATWKNIELPLTFATVPVVMGQVQTMENDPALDPNKDPTSPWITTIVNNISNDNFDIALERSEVDENSIAKGEIIGWMALEAGSGAFNDIVNNSIDFEVRQITGILGWDNLVSGTNCNDNISFTTTFSSTPLVIATKNSRTAADGGWLRRCSLSNTGIGIVVDEDDYLDGERGNATGESIGMLAFSDAFTARFTPGSGEAYLYHFDGTDWQLSETITPDTKGDIGFGTAVGIQTNGNSANIIVGAPKAKNTDGNQKGVVFTYHWDGSTLSSNNTLQGTTTHSFSFGQSLDIKGDYLIVGAPDEEDTVTANDFVGAAYNYKLNGSSWAAYPDIAHYRIKRNTANEKFGTQVAINSDGNVSMISSFDGSSYVYIHAGGTTDWAATQSVGFRNGGGVDIDDGVYLMAQSGGHLHYDINPDGTERPLSFEPTELGAYTSVVLYKEQSIVNDTIDSQAIAIDVPCGIKPGKLKAFEWAIVSVPCGDGTATINDIFADDLGALDINWAMYKQTGYTGTNTPKGKMGSGDKMEPGRGYWIIADADTSWKVDDSVVTTRTNLDFIITNQSEVAGYVDFALPEILTTDAPKKIMAGNPFPRKFDWANAGNLVYASSQPIGWEGIIETVAYVYDPTSTSGQPYSPIAYTPGIPNQIKSYQGFWIKMNPHNTTDFPAGSIKLRLPFEK